MSVRLRVRIVDRSELPLRLMKWQKTRAGKHMQRTGQRSSASRYDQVLMWIDIATGCKFHVLLTLLLSEIYFLYSAVLLLPPFLSVSPPPPPHVRLLLPPIHLHV